MTCRSTLKTFYNLSVLRPSIHACPHADILSLAGTNELSYHVLLALGIREIGIREIDLRLRFK